MSRKTIQARGKRSGVVVAVQQEVLPSGRHVRLEADDPAAPGQKLVHMITVGDETGKVSAERLALDDAAFDAAVAADVAAGAAELADQVESRRRVAAALGRL